MNYSYSASFAVALSGRKVAAVKRIWADGKLLRGAAGDFKSATRFRFYPGDEAQAVDPLIAAAEDIGQAPAFRGIAYALFEDFELADYGNRIPSLSFEVEAEAGPVAIGAVAAELSGGAVIAGETPLVHGYAASGDSVRGAVEALSDIVPLSLVDGGAVLTITAAGGEAATVAAAEAGARPDAGPTGRGEIARQAAGTVADEVSISYYDVARDYQTGLQRATRGGPGRRGDRRALPAALGADAAKAFAEQRLSAAWAGRSGATLHLGWRRSGVRPGARVRIEGQAGLWRVARWTFERMVVRLELVRVADGAAPVTASASAGRPVAEPDLPHGPTTLRLLDLPLHGDLAGDRPQLLAAAAGADAGWRRAALTISYDGGASWQAAGATAAPAVIGTALTMLGDGGSALFDRRGSVEVELLGDAMWLEGRSDAALVGGGNLALLGDELIQFGVAEPLGGRRFRLRRLLRGRRGTEWAAGVHQPGEGFVLIEPQALTLIEPPPATLGGEAMLMGEGIGDEEAALTVRTIAGEAMRPPAPVHLRARREPGGDIAIAWVRRSRAGWAWPNGSDTPLGEEKEAYALRLASAGGAERMVTLALPAFVYTAAQQAEDSATGAITVSVTQIGTHARARAAVAVVPGA